MARRIIPPEELVKDLKELQAAMNGQSPLACTLIAGAAIEHALSSLLNNFFIEGGVTNELLTAPKGTLATFGACADVAYCLGLLSKGMHKNLKTVAKIRNRFAHSHLHIGFDDAEVVSLCKKLTLPRFPGPDGSVVSHVELLKEVKKADRPRALFTLVAANLHSLILLTAHSIQRREPSKWPW
jgi:hypothetical protein